MSDELLKKLQSTRAKAPSVTRRTALGLMGAAGAGLAFGGRAFAEDVAAPAVRKKVKLSFWVWADNPNHQKISTDSVAMFNSSQDFIEVELDANFAREGVRKKVVASYAAGAAPDVAWTIQYWVQDYFENGILQPVEEYFNAWDQKDDYFPSVIEQVRLRPDQPIMYLPETLIPYFMFYRADWFKEVGVAPPTGFDQMLEAAKAVSKAPERYGMGIRGQTYTAIEVMTPIWHSAGVNFIDKDGNVDFDSPAAIEVTEKLVNMVLKDKSAQPSAANDGMQQMYQLMEKGVTGMWLYGPHGGPSLTGALGDNVQAVATPCIGDKQYTVSAPEGPMMLSTCPEKEAAWEFMKFIGSGEPAHLYTLQRSVPTVRKSLASEPGFQENRFLKLALDLAPNYWSPPYGQTNFGNFQEKIAPYWGEALLGSMSPAEFNQTGARLLRREL